jgi:hypothetical protein
LIRTSDDLLLAPKENNNMSSLPDIPEWEYVSVMAMIIFLVLVGGLVAGKRECEQL